MKIFILKLQLDFSKPTCIRSPLWVGASRFHALFLRIALFLLHRVFAGIVRPVGHTQHRIVNALHALDLRRTTRPKRADHAQNDSYFHFDKTLKKLRSLKFTRLIFGFSFNFFDCYFRRVLDFRVNFLFKF